MPNDAEALLKEVAVGLQDIQRGLRNVEAELEAREQGERRLSEAERRRVRTRISLLPDAELIWMLLMTTKIVESGRAKRAARQVLTLVGGECIVRFMPDEAVGRAFSMYEGDEEPRTLDLDGVVEGEHDA